jgi:hypothetical protein
MKIISLGGVGGCDLATALRMFDQPSYPYDWIVSSQSFILHSFDRFFNFFEFTEEYVYDRTVLLEKNKKAVMLHDFSDFTRERDTVIAKYKRRFERLHSALYDSDEPILFVRINDNLEETLVPRFYYDNIFSREEESLERWDSWMQTVSETCGKRCLLLFISSHMKHHNIVDGSNWKNVIVRHTLHHKFAENIHNIVFSVIQQIKTV